MIKSSIMERMVKQSFKATLFKSQFGMGVLLLICCIFSEHLFLRTPLDGYFWIQNLGEKALLFEGIIEELQKLTPEDNEDGDKEQFDQTDGIVNTMFEKTNFFSMNYRNEISG